jgi:hypothetical protein
VGLGNFIKVLNSVFRALGNSAMICAAVVVEMLLGTAYLAQGKQFARRTILILPWHRAGGGGTLWRMMLNSHGADQLSAQFFGIKGRTG